MHKTCLVAFLRETKILVSAQENAKLSDRSNGSFSHQISILSTELFVQSKNKNSAVYKTVILYFWNTSGIHKNPRFPPLSCFVRLWRTDSHQYGMGWQNNAQVHCRPRCNNRPRKLTRKNWKLKNICTTLGTLQLSYMAPDAIIDGITVTHMNRRV